jgi:hypothetical protein
MNDLNDAEEQQAQHIACSHLVRGCESAASELHSATGETDGPSQTTMRAQQILAEVLSSWRHALSVVRPGQEPLSNAAGTLDDWTSDELFAETLTRRAGDGPALRLMQGLTLRAQLTAHDRE